MYKNPTGEYLAVVQFLKGHSITESYARVDKRKLSEKELSIFLQGNSAGKEWKKDPRKLAWERSDPRSCMVRNDGGTTHAPHPRQVIRVVRQIRQKTLKIQRSEIRG